MKTRHGHGTKQTVAAILAMLMTLPCVAAQDPDQIRIVTTRLLHIEPIGVHVDRQPSGTMLRGEVYRGPGYVRWQRNHLLVEVIGPGGRTNLSQTVSFSPEPIPKVGRASGRSLFQLALASKPEPGSTLRVTPQEGPCPKTLVTPAH